MTLNQVTKKTKLESVHLSQWPKVNLEAIDVNLEKQMRLAQDLTSMVFSIRKKKILELDSHYKKLWFQLLMKQLKTKIEAVKSFSVVRGKC